MFTIMKIQSDILDIPWCLLHYTKELYSQFFKHKKNQLNREQGIFGPIGKSDVSYTYLYIYNLLT